jgi:serine/threonine-protein kinase
MGEVYLAQDTTLDRKVALKFLPEELQQDSTARKRFLREAKSAAALDHPYICHIHEVGEAEGKSFISMEYVQGETLKDKLAKGPLLLKDALEKATEVAEALEEAHKQGIVHRDVKPANIMFTPQGHVKVMDFGLAKQITPVEGQEQEITTALTKQGSTLGTVPYMSPEQVRGQAVDTRSDIFSFGVVLYEMLTGVNPFKGDTSADTSHAILGETPPPLTRYTEDIPLLLQHTIKKMLAKEADRRYQLIHDVRTNLGELIEESGDSIREVAAIPSGGTSSVAGWWQRPTAIALMVLAGAALAAGVAWNAAPRPGGDSPTVRFSFGIQTNHGLMTGWAIRRVAISPDGSTIAYLADSQETSADGIRQLYLRGMDESEGTPIPGTEDAADPFFSPDGEWVGFLASGELQRVSVNGGAPLSICKAAQMFGASWAPDDSIIFGGGVGSGLMRVPMAGGPPEPLTSPDPEKGEILHGTPEVLPDGETVLFTIGTGTGSRIALLSLDTGTWEELLPSGASPHYLSAGYLLFSEESSLRLVRFDLEGGQVVGSAFPVLDGVQFENFAGLAEAVFAVSQSGDLVFIPGGLGVSETRPVWVDRSGRENVIETDPAFYIGPVISPDERRRIAVIKLNELGIGEVWVMNGDGSQAFPVAADGADYNPAWTPDGNTLTYTSNGDMYERVVDREDPRSLFLTRENYQLPRSWSPDGQYLAFVENSPNGYNIWVMPRDGDPTPLLDLSFNSVSPRFSPQGGWIAYVSEESGQREVYIRQYPGSARGERVSRGGGRAPGWSTDGRQLFFRNQDQMLAVEITTEPELRIGEPVELWERPYYSQEQFGNYDVAPDGRFLMLGLPESDAPRLVMINVVVNWFSEVQERMKASN